MRGEWARMNHDGDNVPGVFREVKFLSGGSGDGGECNAGKRELQYPASSRRSTNSLDEPATNHWLATLPVGEYVGMEERGGVWR
jgi:hypothetical protein